jgi:hypothetical protein
MDRVLSLGSNLSANQLQSFASTITSFLKKEKQNTLLDPLYAILCIGLLPAYSKGTKISIQNNRIVYQEPGLSQGAIRWIYQDTKEDIHFLYYSIRRFLTWYDIENCNILQHYCNNAIAGLRCLEETYVESNNHLILHTIAYFRFLLEHPELMRASPSTVVSHPNENLVVSSDIEDVFKEIQNVWTASYMQSIWILFATLYSVENSVEDKEKFRDGIRLFLEPHERRTREWIQKNMHIQ